MAITTREDLKNYCLRKLGAPVIEINVDPAQVEDRLDDAIQLFQQYHFMGFEKHYMKHKITASTLSFQGAAPGFVPGEKITGATSGATCRVVDEATNNLSVRVSNTTGTFTTAETVTGDVSNTTATLTVANFYTAGDIDNRYITVPDTIQSVVKILSARATGINIFDVRYQLALNSIFDIANMDLISYDMGMRHMALIDELFIGQKPIRFSHYQRRVNIDFDWSTALIDEYIVLEVHRIIDPEEFTAMYGDTWLREYATALIKRQWAQNLSIYAGVVLLGGVTIDGPNMMTQATTEITALEAQLDKKYSEPVDFLVG